MLRRPNKRRGREKYRPESTACQKQDNAATNRKREIAPAPLVWGITILLVLAVAMALGEKGTRYFVKVESPVKWNSVSCIGLPTRSVTRRQRR